MVSVTVSVDEGVLDVLQTLAEHRHVTVDEVLRSMVIEDLEHIKARMNDPIIGALSSFSRGEDDISERADDIIRDEWQPD